MTSPLPTPDPAARGAQPSAVRFADRTHGWIGVSDGILGTSDGGATWQRQLRSERIARIWSVDATHAWALAADNAIYRTQDGERWSGMPPTTPPIINIDFISPLVGWAIAARPTALPGGGTGPATTATLLATTDGGAVWRPTTSTPLYSVCFSSERTGLGAFGKTIYATADSGRTWVARATLRIGDAGPWFPQLICADEANARVQVTEPYAALSHAPYIVFSTTDAGATWKQEFVEGYTLGSVVGLPAAGLGTYPSLFGVLGDHSTWVVTCSPPADAQTFLILARDGTVVADRRVPFVACARDASFVDADRGWAIATSYALSGTALNATGIVVQTTDGARSWSIVYPR